MTQATTSNELLRQAHRALMADLSELAKATGGTSLSELRSRLEKTRHDLVVHFRLEEENGYLDAVSAREPCLAPTLKKLLAEHRGLLQKLDVLLGQFEFPSPLQEDIQRGVRMWVHEVRGHEIRENDLIQDAFVHDLGAGD